MAQKREKSLTDILRYYGMPEENIDMAINQIAQGYGACRYLDGVKDGAEAVGGTDTVYRCEELGMTYHVDSSD